MSSMRGSASAQGARGEALSQGVDPKREGERLNRRALQFLRQMDARCGQCEAERARRMNSSSEHVHNLHHTLKVLTLPTWVQWCLSQGLKPGEMLDELQAFNPNPDRPK